MFFGLDPAIIALRIPILLIVITVHEFAHARMAYHFGDTTAHSQGRMNLNPINHLDPIGSLMILLVGFGWAKPVPINPRKFNQYRSGLRWVSFAGPLSNLILGFVTMLIFTLLFNTGLFSYGGLAFDFFQQLIMINIYLALFNLVPIPPLDGSKILMSFLSDSHLGIYQQIERYAPIILLMFIFLGVFRVVIFPLANYIVQFYSLIISLLPGF
ncbi:MAG: site-2 protease family protein [Bacillota bacterium]